MGSINISCRLPFHHYLPFHVCPGAAVSWACAANSALNLPRALDAHVFRDRASVMGKLVYDLGNAYQEPGVLQNAASLLYSLQLYSLANLRERAPCFFMRARAGGFFSMTTNCAPICNPQWSTSPT